MAQGTTTADRDYSLEYDKSHARYDFIVNLFQLGRDTLHRLKALKLAGLKQGDTVLDICCGSGLSFAAIQKVIGPAGKIIAVDANQHMLNLARQRAIKHSWENIQFMQADIAKLETAVPVDFALFALCWYDRHACTEWVKHISQLLNPSGKLCFIDYKLPENGLRFIVTPLIGILVKWLGEAYGLEELKWDPRKEISPLLKNPVYKSVYFDSLFTINGSPRQ
jgi:ubiquinone/menaquinone biosynthesis C-methylase UbiE